MVKRQLDPAEVGKPARFGRVVAACEVAAGDAAEVHRRDRVAARVSAGRGVDPEQLHGFDLQAGFFARLACAGGLAGLAGLHEAARQRPASRKRRVSPADQHDAALGVDDDGVGGQHRRRGSGHGHSFRASGSGRGIARREHAAASLASSVEEGTAGFPGSCQLHPGRGSAILL